MSTILAAEFFRWEFATAVACAVIGVDPFDEPNVTESKHNTKRLLDAYEVNGEFARDHETRAAHGQISKFLRQAKARRLHRDSGVSADQR